MAIMEDLGAGITDGTAIWRKAFSPSHVATIDEEEPATVVEAVLLHRQPSWCLTKPTGLSPESEAARVVVRTVVRRKVAGKYPAHRN